jgi:hypothetical protein
MKNISNLGGLDLSRSCLDRDSWSRHWQRAGLDSRENLDSFKKFVSTIEISRFCLDTTIHFQISRSRLRFIETYRDLPKISIISRSRSRSSYNFHKSQSRLLLLIHFTNRHLWKDVTFHNCLLVKLSQKCQEISINLEKSQQKSRLSQKIMGILIYLDDLD